MVRSALLVWLSFAVMSPVWGQVTTDGSVGSAGAQALTGPNFVVPESAGELVGTVLYHSFSEFTVATGQTVEFTATSTVNTIVVRLTGATTTSVDGVVTDSTGAQEVVWVSPVGITLGSNFSFAPNGDLHMSTADGAFDTGGTVVYRADMVGDLLGGGGPNEFRYLNAGVGAFANAGALTFNDDAACTLSGANLMLSAPISIASGGGTPQIGLFSVDSLGTLNFDDQLITNGLATASTISLNASADLTTSGDGELTLYADDLNMEDGTVFTAAAGPVSLRSNTDFLVGQVILTGAGDVTVVCGGNMQDVFSGELSAAVSGATGANIVMAGGTLAITGMGNVGGDGDDLDLDLVLGAGTNHELISNNGGISVAVDDLSATSEFQQLNNLTFLRVSSRQSLMVDTMQASNGNSRLLLSSLNGDLSITQPQMANTGFVTLSATGAISCGADGDVLSQATNNTLAVQAGTGAVTMADGTVFQTAGAPIQINGDAVALGELNAVNGAITVISGTSITEVTAAETANITGGAATLTATSGALGGADPADLDLAVSSLTTTSSGDQHLVELDRLDALNLESTGGVLNLTVGGTLLDPDAAADFTAGTLNLISSSGDVGAPGGGNNALDTDVDVLNVDTSAGNGSQWIQEQSGLTGLMLSAGTGSVVLNVATAIMDADMSVDVSGSLAVLTADGGGIGSSGNPIGTQVDDLSVFTSTTGDDQFIDEADGLSGLDLNAGSGNVTLSAGGAVFDTVGTPDVVGNTVDLSADGALGASGSPIEITAADLRCDTSSANADQWVEALTPITLSQTPALSAGVGEANLADGEFLLSGSVDAFELAVRGTLSGTGTVTSALSVQSGGRLEPGVGLPQVWAVNGLGFSGNGVFEVQVGGTSPGNGMGFHDQIQVTGAVTLSGGGLEFDAVGGFTLSLGDEFVVIDNDGTDAVSGTFAGIPEGGTIPFLLGTNLNGRVSYVGGDGNDVTVTAVPDADLDIDLDADTTTPPVGGIVTLTVTLTNLGPNPTTNVTATAQLPNLLTYDDHTTARGSYAPSSGVWTVGTLAVSETVTLEIEARVDTLPAGTQITAEASVTSSDLNDSSSANNTDQVVLRPTGGTVSGGGGGGGGGGGCALSPRAGTPGSAWPLLALLLVVRGLCGRRRS